MDYYTSLFNLVGSPYTTENPQVITQSEIRSFLECQRKWWFSYVRLIKPARYSAIMKVGILSHAGFAAMLRGLTEDAIVAEIGLERNRQEHEMIKQGIRFQESDIVQSDFAETVAIAMILGWIKKYGTLPEEIAEIWAVEHTFRHLVRNDLVVMGRIDGMGVSNHGIPVLTEFKTHNQTGENYRDMLNLEWQTHFYAWALEEIHIHAPENPTSIIAYAKAIKSGEMSVNQIRSAHFFTAKRPSSNSRPNAKESAAQREDRVKSQPALWEQWLQLKEKDRPKHFPLQPETVEQFRDRVISKYENEPETMFIKEWVPLDRNAVVAMPRWIEHIAAQMVVTEMMEKNFRVIPPPSFSPMTCKMCAFKTRCDGTEGVEFVKKNAKHEELTDEGDDYEN